MDDGPLIEIVDPSKYLGKSYYDIKPDKTWKKQLLTQVIPIDIAKQITSNPLPMLDSVDKNDLKIL